MRALTTALRATIVTLILTGLIYPFVVTGFAQLLFSSKANGSLISDEKGRVIGSELISQGFSNGAYLQPRPSAAGDKGYDATSSGGSNLGPTSKKLKDRIDGDLVHLRKENPDAPGAVPDELVTASGSGLDPHLSPSAALWQAPRIARARAVAIERVQRVIESHIEGPDLRLLGEARVNVLLVNVALDQQLGAPSAPSPKG